MSRHRIVRRINYEDECYDEDDDYGQSYEDRYCVSPSTAAQFTYNREQNYNLSSYMEDEIPEEDEMGMDSEPMEAQAAAPTTGRETLSDIDRVRLQSCLEEIHNVMGDSQGDAELKEAILRNNFSIQATLDELLSQTGAPKPQRTPRKKRERAQGDDADIEALLSEISFLDQQEHQFNKAGMGVRFRFHQGMSPPVGLGTGSSRESRGSVSSIRSSPSSVGSPSSLSGTDGYLPQGMRGLGKTGRGDSGSDTTSTPPQFASPPRTPLMALIQQQSAVEQQSSGDGGQPFQKSKDTISLRKNGDSSGPESVSSSVLKEEGSKSSGQSLSDIIRAQKNSMPQPSERTSANSSAASGGLSLSDLIRAQEISASDADVALQTSVNSSLVPQKQEQKATSGLSLSELIAQNKQSSFSLVPSVQSSAIPTSSNSSSSSSLVSSSSAASSLSSLVSSSGQEGKGLSLKELISLHNNQKNPDKPVGKTSGQTNVNSSGSSDSSSVAGLSLSQLIQSRSKCKSKPAAPAVSCDSPPSHSDSFLAGLNVSTRPSLEVGGCSGMQMERKERVGTMSEGGGLSLSELVRQHQSKGSKQYPPSSVNSSRDIIANTTQNKENTDLAVQLEHRLILKPKENLTNTHDTQDSKDTVLKDKCVRNREAVALSLADCLKKKMTFQLKHSKPETPGIEDDSPESDEEEEEIVFQKVTHFEPDCFDPTTVDPALKKAPSLLARCICLQISEKYSFEESVPAPKKRKVQFPEFQYSYQTRKRKVHAEVPLHKVARFDFGTPSPDDIVQARQKGAFTRTGQHAPEDLVSNP